MSDFVWIGVLEIEVIRSVYTILLFLLLDSGGMKLGATECSYNFFFTWKIFAIKSVNFFPHFRHEYRSCE